MKKALLLAVSMLLTSTLFAADIFLRGSVNGWGDSDDFKFATSDNVVYTLEKSFDLFGDFKFASSDWSTHDYGSNGSAVAIDTEISLVKAGSNFSCGSNSYAVTKIVLDLSKMTAVISGKGGELEIKSHTVVGLSTDIFGTAWDPANTDNDMVREGETDIWKLTKENISLLSGTDYEFKIVANHAWGVKDCPTDASNLSFSVSESGYYDVNFEYDAATNTGNGYATKKSEPTTFDTYIAIGDAALFFVDWKPSPIGVEYFTLETTDGIHYTKTVENVPIKTAGTFAYGFSKNGSTTEILFADKSKTVTVDEAGAYNIAVSLTVAPGEEPKAEAILTKVDPGTTYYIAGNGADFAPDVDWCCGENWNEKGCPMESGFFTRDLPAGTYLFKITDGTLDNNWGYDAVDATQSTAGYYDAGGNNIGIKLSAELSTVGVKFDGSKIVLEWTEKEAPAEFDTWTLVGDMPPFPVAWTITPGFDLQTTDGVVYTLVADDVDMTVDKFQYGFRKNHTEDFAPLEAKYTATLAEGTGSYKVEITLDFTVATDPKVTVNFTKNVTPTYDYYIAGNGDGLNGWTCGITWDPAGCGMAEGQYKAHVQPGTYEFKITNGKWATEGGKEWGVGAVDATKSTPGYEGTDNVKFTVNSEANITVTFDGASIILLSDVPFGEATITSWTAVGEAGLFENAWTPTDESNDMQFVGGVYQLVKTGLTLEAKDYLYKFTANHTWSVSEIPSGNATLTIAEAGKYKVTFYLNPATGEFDAVPEKEVDPGFDTWTLVGDMPPFPAAWTAIAAFDLKTTDGVVYTLSAEDVDMPVAEFQYGFRKNHTEEYAPLDEKYTATLPEGTGKYSVDVKLDFTVAAAPKVEVIFTKKQEPPVTGVTVNVEVPEGTPSCFFYGDFSGNTFVEMTKVDNTHYTISFPDKSPEEVGWGYKFCWDAKWETQAEPETTYDITDGTMCVVLGWKTQPGTEYHYTTYNDWQVRTDWNGNWDPEIWLTLTPNNDGTFSGIGEWGKGSGVNLASNDGPVKKNWYAADDADITIEPGLAVGTQVRITLTVISDDQVNIRVEDANPTSADEAVEDSIYATNGTVFCSTPFEVYNLVGQNVTAQNGSLFGIYIVKTANTVKTVSVK